MGEEDAVLKEVWKAYYIDPYVHGPGRSAANTVEHPTSAAGRASGGISAA